MKNRMLIAAALVSLCFAGCGGSNQKEPESTDGPMENAGEAVDNAAEDVEQGGEDAVDATGDAIGEGGQAVDDATEDEN